MVLLHETSFSLVVNESNSVRSVDRRLCWKLPLVFKRCVRRELDLFRTLTNAAKPWASKWNSCPKFADLYVLVFAVTYVVIVKISAGTSYS